MSEGIYFLILKTNLLLQLMPIANDNEIIIILFHFLICFFTFFTFDIFNYCEADCASSRNTFTTDSKANLHKRIYITVSLLSVSCQAEINNLPSRNIIPCT